METHWLKSFIKAAKYENLRLASEELFISQPAVTKHIQSLEKNLNTQLFIRQNKSIRLNQNGEMFLPIAQEIIDTYEAGIHQFQQYVEGFERELTIAVAPQIANSMLPSILKQFSKQKSHVSVRVEIIKSNEIANSIQSGQSHVGLSKIKPVNPVLSVKCLIDEPIVCVGPKHLESMDMVEIIRQEKVLTHEYAPYWDEVNHQLQQQFTHTTNMKVNQTEAIKQMILEGIGVAFLPKSVVRKELEDDRLALLATNILNTCTSKTYFISKHSSAETEHLFEICKSIYGT
ncbi:LysR family transcriptional regulator [Viridibacillus sp. FSL R5-0477]|uniref:Putative HTH-type transcriptional regulator yxjO n=1 Tax=Viridibacillus arenosi FSL R5-213 TaxID=1227360 RepID=W4F3R3_9BACL|nr:MULTISPECIES: LysR family transcriptional regulator [Viridibacillus]ETT86691.1 putative HTH-type transcriptional regulator yxjO [Viridibacillus arenosi FSL R5-213]OMC83496.1 LysR family transcriptional regulator [Viridibacillus sp. FSL H8-0123]OMC89538.1 LysR family transcriptional regulator [Viridibacillus arenosi]